jgi:hypothetical protein
VDKKGDPMDKIVVFLLALRDAIMNIMTLGYWSKYEQERLDQIWFGK